MNQWANTVLTDKGAALLAKLAQGNTLNITRTTTGVGFVTPGLLTKQIEVTGPKQELAFKSVTYPENGKCAIPVSLKNDALGVGYEATQIGLYAMDPDEGEILLIISQAPDANSGTIVPSATEMPGYSAEWTFYLQYGQANGVTVTVDPTGTVSREEMEQALAEKAPAPFVITLKYDIEAQKHWVDKTLAELQAAYQAGRHIRLTTGQAEYALTEVLSNMARFSAHTENTVYCFDILADGTVIQTLYHAFTEENPPTAEQLGAAPASHGNHVPATQTADNAKFLRNDNTWQKVTPANIGAAATGHKHTKSEITDFPSSMTPTAHNQAASTITAGTLAGKVNANATAAATVGTAQVRDIYAGTEDMTAGTTPLATGVLYFVYE